MAVDTATRRRAGKPSSIYYEAGFPMEPHRSIANLRGDLAAARQISLKFLLFAVVAAACRLCAAQALPTTAGQTLSGNRIVLADAARGRVTILVAAFSHAGGMATSPWMKAIRADPALAGTTVYQVAMLAGAPGFIRGMIETGMRKGLSPQELDHFIVLTRDEKIWRSYFDVSDDKDPYVVLIDATGRVLWHGHGAATLEPELKAALH